MVEELSVFSVQSQSFQQVMTVYGTIFFFPAFSAFSFLLKKPNSTHCFAASEGTWNKEDVWGGAGLITVLICE